MFRFVVIAVVAVSLLNLISLLDHLNRKQRAFRQLQLTNESMISAGLRRRLRTCPHGAESSGSNEHELQGKGVLGWKLDELWWQLWCEDSSVNLNMLTWNFHWKVAAAFFAGMIAIAPAAFAADLENGAQVFAGNCAACHAGGNNVIQNEKVLSKTTGSCIKTW